MIKLFFVELVILLSSVPVLSQGVYSLFDIITESNIILSHTNIWVDKSLNNKIYLQQVIILLNTSIQIATHTTTRSKSTTMLLLIQHMDMCLISSLTSILRDLIVILNNAKNNAISNTANFEVNIKPDNADDVKENEIISS